MTRAQGFFAKQSNALARRKAVMDSLAEPFYTVRETAKLLKRRKADVYRMIEAGEIDAVEVGSGSKREKRIPKAEIARVLVPAPLDFLRDIYVG